MFPKSGKNLRIAVNSSEVWHSSVGKRIGSTTSSASTNLTKSSSLPVLRISWTQWRSLVMLQKRFQNLSWPLVAILAVALCRGWCTEGLEGERDQVLESTVHSPWVVNENPFINQVIRKNAPLETPCWINNFCPRHNVRGQARFIWISIFKRHKTHFWKISVKLWLKPFLGSIIPSLKKDQMIPNDVSSNGRPDNFLLSFNIQPPPGVPSNSDRTSHFDHGLTCKKLTPIPSKSSQLVCERWKVRQPPFESKTEASWFFDWMSPRSNLKKWCIYILYVVNIYIYIYTYINQTFLGTQKRVGGFFIGGNSQQTGHH